MKLFIALSLALSFFSAGAQNLSIQLLASSGRQDSGKDIQLEWTLGDLVTTTAYHDEGMITQGFLQPEKIRLIKTDLSAENKDIHVSVFPNPASSYIYITHAGGNDNLTYQIQDEAGRPTGRSCALDASGKTLIYLGNYTQGIYFLRVFDIYGNLIATQKLAKLD